MNENFKVIETHLRKLDQLMQSVLDEPHFIVENLLEQGIYYDFKSNKFEEFEIETIIGGKLLDVRMTPYELVKFKSLNNLFICDSLDITLNNDGFTEEDLFEFLKSLKFNYFKIQHAEDLFVFETNVEIEFDASEFVQILKNKLADVIINLYSNEHTTVTTRGPKSDLAFVVEHI